MITDKKVRGYINRQSMLYVTSVEYGDYTMNHVLGCAHGCNFPCYAYLMKKRFGQVGSYNDWLQPYLVSNTLELLDKEIPKLKDKIKSVHLCFATDPFMYGYSEIINMSLASLQKLNEAEIQCNVLTKGILPLELASYSKRNEYGITLISLNEQYRQFMEPGAAPYKERLKAMEYLHQKGCKTWVSIEPYPTPNLIDQDLTLLLDAISFTDKIIFGRTNYNKEISKFKDYKQFYNNQAQIVIDYCIKHDIQYHIKDKTITSNIKY